MSSVPATRSTRDRIVDAVVRLLAAGGLEAVSTRAVSDAAGVQAPTIYRLFGDKQGLLDAAAERVFAEYLADKRRRVRPEDPVESLRAGWDDQIELALANPPLYLLMYDTGRSAATSPAASTAFAFLAERVRAVALAGRLRVGERRAVGLLHSTGRGVALTLIGSAEEDRDRDRGLSEAAREAVIAAITTDPAPAHVGPGASAVTLRASLPLPRVLSPGESALLAEWLDRIADVRGAGA